MPQNRTYTVYRFDELSESSQRNAIALLQESRKESVSNHLEELLGPYLKEWGYSTENVEYVLNFTPDDGVAFYGTCDHIILSSRIYADNPHAKEIVQKYVQSVDIIGYYQGLGMNAELEMSEETPVMTEEDNEILESFRHRVWKDARSCAQQLKEMGYAEIKAANDEEVIRKAIETNDWWFHADGRLA